MARYRPALEELHEERQVFAGIILTDYAFDMPAHGDGAECGG